MADQALFFAYRQPQRYYGKQDLLACIADHRRNYTETVFASAARTTTTISGPLTNHDARIVIAILRITVASGTGGLQVYWLGIDPVTSANYQISTVPTALTATGIYQFVIGPNINAMAATSTTVQQHVVTALTRKFSLGVIHGDATSYTYSLAMCQVP